jgi:hypothetical protein
MHSKQYVLDCGGPILSPILGIIASQNYPRITNSYESIATVLVGSGGSATISFTSIPSTYKHLQIRGIARSTRADFAIDQLYTRFNSDTGSNYSWHWLSGNGSTASTDVGTSATSMNLGWFATNAAASVTNAFGGLVIDILDYANTSKYKTVRTLIGNDLNGGGSPFTGTVSLISGLWQSTSAITSISFDPSAADFAQYSSFALYGIRG